MTLFWALAAAALLVFAVDGAKGSKEVEQAKAALKAGIVKALETAAKDGKKYTKEEAEDKLKDIVLIEAVAIGRLLRRIGEIEKNPNLAAQIAKAVIGSSEVQQAFKKLLPGEVAPRFVGALVMGITQLATDAVKMGMTRY